MAILNSWFNVFFSSSAPLRARYKYTPHSHSSLFTVHQMHFVFLYKNTFYFSLIRKFTKVIGLLTFLSFFFRSIFHPGLDFGNRKKSLLLNMYNVYKILYLYKIILICTKKNVPAFHRLVCCTLHNARRTLREVWRKSRHLPSASAARF